MFLALAKCAQRDFISSGILSLSISFLTNFFTCGHLYFVVTLDRITKYSMIFHFVATLFLFFFSERPIFGRSPPKASNGYGLFRDKALLFDKSRPGVESPPQASRSAPALSHPRRGSLGGESDFILLPTGRNGLAYPSPQKQRA